MKRLVVDASVAIKWFLPEIHSMESRQLLNGDYELLAPDLLFIECGNILWKQVRHGAMTPEEALKTAQALQAIPLNVFSSTPLVQPAIEIASREDRTVYDSIYLALAVQEKSIMITADLKLYNALQISPLKSFLQWIQDLP